MTDKSTDLMVPDDNRLIAAFAEPKQVDDILSAIEKEVKSFVPDLRTAKSRKDITSLAFKVTRSKTAFDEVGKKINEEGRKKLNAVDAERRKIRETLDALAKGVKAPLVEWNGLEERRIDAHKARLELFTSVVNAANSSEMIEVDLERIEAIEVGKEWEEFQVGAKAKKMEAVVTLKGYLLTATQREANEKELAELRAEKAERDRKDADTAEAKRIEDERIRHEEAEKERKAQQERDKKAAAEKAREEAEAKALVEAAEAEAKHERELAEAKQREEQAAQNERDRIAREKQREKDAEIKRAANKRRRKKVFTDIEIALETIEHKDIPQALLDGKIPHVKVEF